MRRTTIVIVCFFCVGIIVPFTLAPSRADASGLREELSVPFTTGTDGKSTANRYDGQLNVTVAGTGQAAGTQRSDAFYIYTDEAGNATQPYHLANGYNFGLWVNGNPPDTYMSAIPVYRADHTYTFSLQVAPGNVVFGIGDYDTRDNTGSLRLTITGEDIPALYTITGKVVDTNKRPVPNVTIEADTHQTAVSATDGSFQLSLPAGERTLSAKKERYTFKPNSYDFALKKDAALVFRATSGKCTPEADPADKAASFRYPLSSSATPYDRFKDIYQQGNWAGSYHSGVDYHVGPNAPVYAVANGSIVERTPGLGGYGTYIVIRHTLPKDKGGTKVYSVYAHMANSNPAPPRGCPVVKGQLLGYEGKTGEGSNLYFLHFELRKQSGFVRWNTPPYSTQGGGAYHNIENFYDPDQFIANSQ